ncbi:MAG: DUF748 domain-containing protein [Xanthomonadales bacterium]|nr:DUF748 domain-containing protein [Xanthomonadales bacterium]
MSAWTRHRRLWISLAVVVVVLVIVRLLLAGWVASYVNSKLDRMGDYHGELDSVSLHLWRGAYSIHDLRIERVDGKLPVPLLAAPRIDLAVSWRALLHGGIVATVDFEQPQVNFVDGPGKNNQSGTGVDWRRQLEELLPIRLDEVNVHQGSVHFRNFASEPRVDLMATAVDGVVTNLSNVRANGARPAHLEATAKILGNAPLETSADFDPLGDLTDFDFRVKVTGIDLTRANDLLQAYAKLDVEKGSGDFVMELKAREGQLDGYAKPLFRDVEIFNWKSDVEEKGKNPLQIAWEALAGGIENLFKNQRLDQFATRVEIHGRIGDTKTSAWQAIVAILRNAFVEAFKPKFERLPTRSPDDGEG